MGFADDDKNGMTGVRYAWLHRQHRHRRRHRGVGGAVDPGMRRFGFNPFGRDVADEIHADLLRLAEAGIRPHSAGGSPWKRRGALSTSTRSADPWVAPSSRSR